MKYLITSLIISSLIYGCASQTDQPIPGSGSKSNFSANVPKYSNRIDQPDVYQVKDFHIIKQANNDTIGVNAFVEWNYGKYKGFYRASFMEGWLPDGRDLGFDRKAGARIRAVMFKCDMQDAVVVGTWVQDMELKSLHKQLEGVGDKIVPIESDPALKLGIEYLCAIGIS